MLWAFKSVIKTCDQLNVFEIVNIFIVGQFFLPQGHEDVDESCPGSGFQVP